jgi:hypothetical protein
MSMVDKVANEVEHGLIDWIDEAETQGWKVTLANRKEDVSKFCDLGGSYYFPVSTGCRGESLFGPKRCHSTNCL